LTEHPTQTGNNGGSGDTLKRKERADHRSAQAIDHDRCVPGSVFIAKPYQHIDILSACQRLRK
jgi:hypothetical protein